MTELTNDWTMAQPASEASAFKANGRCVDTFQTTATKMSSTKTQPYVSCVTWRWNIEWTQPVSQTICWDNTCFPLLFHIIIRSKHGPLEYAHVCKRPSNSPHAHKITESFFCKDTSQYIVGLNILASESLWIGLRYVESTCKHWVKCKLSKS